MVFALPKGGRLRDVPLPDVVSDALAAHITRRPPIDVNVAVEDPSREHGMHALRHYYASVLLDSGENIKALAEYLGHSDPGCTLRTYTHLMPNSQDRARRAIDAAFGAPGADAGPVKPVR